EREAGRGQHQRLVERAAPVADCERRNQQGQREENREEDREPDGLEEEHAGAMLSRALPRGQGTGVRGHFDSGAPSSSVTKTSAMMLTCASQKCPPRTDPSESATVPWPWTFARPWLSVLMPPISETISASWFISIFFWPRPRSTSDQPNSPLLIAPRAVKWPFLILYFSAKSVRPDMISSPLTMWMR